ncbi:polysaccharide deacetylase family protein [Lentibacillus sp. L22]|uniref:polysaccharide deacetylase family protein n=1 Tax=Lentibacillus TaxID=175304 RepID=UPI0022B0D4EE|nr:polysaccharide deacetylase family protein [Lentibacillus daqui]
MKVFVLLSWFVFLLASCSAHTEKEQSDKEDVAVTKTEKTPADGGKGKDKQKNEEKTENARTPKYKISDAWSVVPISKHANEKVVLLTFDDAPDEHALDIAKTLKKLDASAIFFVNGHFLKSPEKKQELKQIHDMGFVIGNHTYNHTLLPDVSKEKQKEEIVRVDDMVEKIIGEKPKFFRAPNGANTDYSKQIVKDEGMTLMNWSYGYDWNKEYMSKDAITDIMLHTDLLNNGANLLMHDRPWTAAAIKDIVTGLRDQGYEIVDPKLIR